MTKLLTGIFSVLNGLNPMFVTITSAVVSALSVFTWVNSLWADVIARVDALAVTSFSGTLTVAPVGFLNTFIPLQEAMTAFTAWLALITAAALIRIVKSFIPTVAS